MSGKHHWRWPRLTKRARSRTTRAALALGQRDGRPECASRLAQTARDALSEAVYHWWATVRQALHWLESCGRLQDGNAGLAEKPPGARGLRNLVSHIGSPALAAVGQRSGTGDAGRFGWFLRALAWRRHIWHQHGSPRGHKQTGRTSKLECRQGAAAIAGMARRTTDRLKLARPLRMQVRRSSDQYLAIDAAGLSV